MKKNINRNIEELVLLKPSIRSLVLATVSQRLIAAINSNYFLVADWSEGQELRL